MIIERERAPEKNAVLPWRWVALGLAAVVLAVYLPFAKDFFWEDDFALLLRAKTAFSPAHPLTFLTGSLNGLFTPLNSFLFWLEFQAFGLDPLGYRLVSIGLHLGNSLLVVSLAWLLTRSRPTAVLAGGIFALGFAKHEAVDWVCAFVHLVTTACFLGAVIFFLRWRTTEARRDYALSLAAFLLGCCSKEPIVTLPLVILLCVLVLRAPFPARTARVGAALPFLILGALYAAGMYWWQKFGPGAVMLHEGIFRLGPHVLENIAMLGSFLLPMPSSMIEHFLARLPVPHLAAVYGALAWLVLALFVALLAGAYRFGSDVARFCVLWILVTFLPFTPVTAGIGSRYLYLPSVGFSVLVAVLARAAWARYGRVPGAARWLYAGLGLYVLCNLVPFVLLQGKYQRDGVVRQEIIGDIARRAPWPTGSLVAVDNLKWSFRDLDLALPLWVPGVPPRLWAGPAPGLPEARHVYHFVYRQGRLVPQPSGARRGG